MDRRTETTRDPRAPGAAAHGARTYLLVFATLMVLTILTVGVARLDLPGPTAVAAALALATAKGALVAGAFMHLLTEHRSVVWLLAATVLLALLMLLVPLATRLTHAGL